MIAARPIGKGEAKMFRLIDLIVELLVVSLALLVLAAPFLLTVAAPVLLLS